jgi:hypothetical protein
MKAISSAVILSLVALPALAEPSSKKVFELQRTSTFEPGSMERNPFWPIGWRKEETRTSAPQVSAPVIVLDLPANHFTVSSILIGTPRMAVLNGREYAEGEMITTRIDGQPTKMKLKTVGDGFVIVEYRGKEYRFDLRVR